MLMFHLICIVILWEELEFKEQYVVEICKISNGLYDIKKIPLHAFQNDVQDFESYFCSALATSHVK